MCGRFTLTVDGEQLAEQLDLPVAPEIAPRYNIAPTQPVAAVRASMASGRRELTYFHWGLIPSWAKDLKMGARMINARAETAAEKPAFRAALKYRRCLVPADGFYEWQKTNGKKQPIYIKMADGRPFAFAGLWEHWQGADGSEIESCTLLTTSPNELVRPIHDRMPVILQPDDYDLWLDPKIQTADRLQPLLQPYPAEAMTYFPVSTLVNTPQIDDPRCVEPWN
jgi:putative SOS response-associated peptidase YedK